MPETLISTVQFEAVRAYFLSRAYELFNVDPDYRLYCHVPGELVSLTYWETYYSGEFNMPQKGDKRVEVYFNEGGTIIPPPSPLPSVMAEIPLNSGRKKEPDNDLLMRMLVPGFMR
jgi:hypothetical protein